MAPPELSSPNSPLELLSFCKGQTMKFNDGMREGEGGTNFNDQV